MIFAFDFPKVIDDWVGRPNKWDDENNSTFNGLIGYPKDITPCYGVAPPSINNIIEKFEKKQKICSVEDAIKTGERFFYLLETYGDPLTWLGTGEKSWKLFDGMSDLALECVRSGKCKIILWSANEGYDPFEHRIFEVIYSEIEKKNIKCKDVIFISGNQIIDSLNLVWGKLNGTNDLIRAIPFNNEIYDNFSKMESEQSSFQNKKFICFNRMPRLQRIVFFNLLSKYKLINEGYVSFPEQNFGTFPSNLDYSNYLKNTLQFDNDLRTSLIKTWKSEIKNLPYIVDTNDWNPNLYGLMTSEIYKKTYFSIVTESLYNDVSVFVDEKIWKPMYNNHPFIVVGCPFTLKKLRDMGFKTFEPYIDESYDEEPHHGKRMLKIINVVNDMCSMSDEDLGKMRHNMEDILKFNKQRLLNYDGFDHLYKILENCLE